MRSLNRFNLFVFENTVKDKNKTKDQLIEELHELRRQVAEDSELTL